MYKKFFLYSFYYFIKIDEKENLKLQLDMLLSCKKIRGTILIADEGINVSISGEKNELDKFGGKLIFTPGDIVHSSTKFLNYSAPNLDLEKLDSTMRGNKISFEDLIKISSKKKEVELKYDLERNVNLIKFSEGKIDIAFNENLSKNFVRNLSEKLLAWTKKRWVITLAKGEGQKTFLETKSINEKDTLDKEKKGDLYKKFKSVFNDIELVDVSEKD